MDKQQFFDLLHKNLGIKYSLTPRNIETIRSFSIGYNKSRKEIAEWVVKKLNNPRRHVVFLTGKKLPHSQSRTNSKEYYQTLLNFVASCSQESWADITQKTPFDKEGRGADYLS